LSLVTSSDTIPKSVTTPWSVSTLILSGESPGSAISAIFTFAVTQASYADDVAASVFSEASVSAQISRSLSSSGLRISLETRRTPSTERTSSSARR